MGRRAKVTFVVVLFDFDDTLPCHDVQQPSDESMDDPADSDSDDGEDKDAGDIADTADTEDTGDIGDTRDDTGGDVTGVSTAGKDHTPTSTSLHEGETDLPVSAV